MKRVRLPVPRKNIPVDLSDDSSDSEDSDEEDKRPVASAKKKLPPVASKKGKHPNRKSDCPGVSWHAPTGKWIGHINNPLKRTISGWQKHETTPCFSDEQECIEATNALRQRIHVEYWEHCTSLAAADPLTKGLTRGPDDAAEADEKTVYWRPNYRNDHKPYRAVRVSAGKTGVIWVPSCQHGVGAADCCPHQAKQAVEGGPREFCATHGGRCPHGTKWNRCRKCNEPNVTRMMSNCSSCAVRIDAKRQESKGGNGLCSMCEDHAKNEAAENGSDPPAKGKTWENIVLDELIPLVVDKEGLVICYESRDDIRHMLGSNKRSRKGECSTAHQRRPDLLYIVRDADARIVAALLVEVDEHSHTTYTSECEAGKVDETFQSILKLAQEEGKSRLAETRSGDIRTPFLLFYKFNPNACDAPGGAIKLSTRIQVLARMCNTFLNTDPAAFHKLSDEGQCLTPHVQCLYYHTKEGGAHLAYFDEHATGAWNWKGNDCPRK